ncbi:WAT1-related protein At1g09380-like [Impatiens glandulifera]|uniref:WAT1-related protein At1g09380-like n=1 Tax=Impatiens glandulifera TaxID=253017 RepID=UPI001FB151CB|nr:WAT1-related protein At1g09380-like [Impatiens glandulifera]
MGKAGVVPFLAMVLVQFGYAGMNILSKLAMDSGMNPFIHVAYRQIFASIVIAPVAYILERKIRPKMTLPILLQIFWSSFFGATLNQALYFVGLKNSTPTIACALSNLLPAFTFILAAIFRLEKVGLKRLAGQAKVFGTFTCVGGAMLLSFYQGKVVIGSSGFHWGSHHDMGKNNNVSLSHSDVHHNHHEPSAFVTFLMGPLIVMASAFAWAVWFVIQARISEKYPAPYSSSAIICFMASFQCVLIGLCFDHKPSSWSLAMPIRAISSIYAGVICTALAFCIMSWCIQKRGPLYVSVFSPLLLVIVAALSWILLGEKLYVGTLLGSVLIVTGLYSVLWGKKKEALFEDEAEVNQLKIRGVNEEEEELRDLEMQNAIKRQQQQQQG